MTHCSRCRADAVGLLGKDDPEAKRIMENTQKEEFIHFAMDLEFLLRKKKTWRTIMKNVLFKPGDIVENAEKAEEKVED